MKVLLVLSLVLCSGIFANGRVEWQDDPAYDLEEILGDLDDDIPFDQFIEDGSSG